MTDDSEDSEAKRGPSPRWLDGKNVNRTNHKVSKAHEKRLAQRLGGKRYSGSGNKKWKTQGHRTADWHSNPEFSKKNTRRGETYGHEDTDCGDLVAGDFHYEHKFTRAASITLQRDWLEKVTEGATRHMKSPGLIITFQNNRNEPLTEWVALPLDTFERLLLVAKDRK